LISNESFDLYNVSHAKTIISFHSDGCIHVHPTALLEIDSILVKELGVVIHTNPFGENPYPYKPQGLLSVEQID